ncbi:MAG: flavodoxin [Campylobacteraceae bacterium]|nr:flavodoxin [Campylobacteraceae bacterium]
MATAIFYGSSTGNTEDIANRISEQLGNLDVYDISNQGLDPIKDYDKLIIGLSTWGDGDLQSDFEDIWSDFEEYDFSKKTIALFGLGDQDGYEDEFVNALGTMYKVLKAKGATIIGFTSIEGFEYNISTAQIDDKFCGLVIDEDNQNDLSDERISSWISDIRSEIL